MNSAFMFPPPEKEDRNLVSSKINVMSDNFKFPMNPDPTKLHNHDVKQPQLLQQEQQHVQQAQCHEINSGIEVEYSNNNLNVIDIAPMENNKNIFGQQMQDHVHVEEIPSMFDHTEASFDGG